VFSTLNTPAPAEQISEAISAEKPGLPRGTTVAIEGFVLLALFNPPARSALGAAPVDARYVIRWSSAHAPRVTSCGRK
jgi:hypothetical protein